MSLIHRKRVRMTPKMSKLFYCWRLKLIWGTIRVVLVLLHNTVYYIGLLYHAFSSICSYFSKPFLDLSTTSFVFILTFVHQKCFGELKNFPPRLASMPVVLLLTSRGQPRYILPVSCYELCFCLLGFICMNLLANRKTIHFCVRATRSRSFRCFGKLHFM